MINRTWVENMIGLIIVLNIFVLAYMFLIPRAQFISAHWNLSSETLMETTGAKDTPNQYSRNYRVANQIRKITGETSIILMPGDDWEFSSSRSVMIQRLYPRKIYFFGDKGFESRMRNLIDQKKEFFVVFNEDWGRSLCKARRVQALNNPGFGICRIENGFGTEANNSL